MPELGPLLGEYVDAVAPPVTFEEVVAQSPLAPPTAHRRRWPAIAAVVALIAAVGGYVALRTERERELGQRVQTRPDPEPQRTRLPEPGWLTPFGEEQPMPSIPDGWQLLDYESARFAVPADWQLVSECHEGASPPGPLVVFPVWGGTADLYCPAPTRQAAVRLRAPGAHPGLADPVAGYRLDVVGPEADRVRATLTDSGERRVLQRGPVADTTGWHEAELEGIALRVPADWPVVDLTTEAGATYAARLACTSNVVFPTEQRPAAFVGNGGYRQCEATERQEDLRPGEGVWMRGARTDPGVVAAEGRVGGIDVVIGRFLPTGPDPALELMATNGVHWVYISIGTRDVPVARAILRSLHRVAG